MPVEFSLRCSQCKELKPRSEFASRVTRVDTNDVKSREWLPYCRTCIKEHPELYDDLTGTKKVWDVPEDA